jgi:hypothetical protein
MFMNKVITCPVIQDGGQLPGTGEYAVQAVERQCTSSIFLCRGRHRFVVQQSQLGRSARSKWSLPAAPLVPVRFQTIGCSSALYKHVSW